MERDEKKARYILAIQAALTASITDDAEVKQQAEMLALDMESEDFDGTLFFACIPTAAMLLMKDMTDAAPQDPVDAAFMLARLVMQESFKSNE